jgi:hypothetical protein
MRSMRYNGNIAQMMGGSTVGATPRGLNASAVVAGVAGLGGLGGLPGGDCGPAGSCGTSCGGVSCNTSCDGGTCGTSCGNTCDNASCDDTCGNSCGDTCGGSCESTCGSDSCGHSTTYGGDNTGDPEAGLGLSPESEIGLEPIGIQAAGSFSSFSR